MVNNLDFNATEERISEKKTKRKKERFDERVVCPQIRDLPQTQFPRKDVR